MSVQATQIQDQLKKCHTTSSLTRTVLAKYARTGELAVLGTPLLKVADMEQVYPRTYITSEQLSEMKLGQKVTVYSDHDKEVRREYPGVITWISDNPEPTPKTILTKDGRVNLVHAIKVAAKDNDTLKIGMYGGVEFK